MRKAEAYIDTVVTVFLNLLIVYVVMSLFSYMITYQKLNSVADNIIRCAAISGTTDDEVIGDKIDEYITDAGFDCTKVTCSFNGTEYMSDSTKNVQFGDTVILNLKTKQTYKFIGKSGVGIFNISVNKIALSEKYHRKDQTVDNTEPAAYIAVGQKFPDVVEHADIYVEGGYI